MGAGGLPRLFPYALFPLGRVVMTRGVAGALEAEAVLGLLSRHVRGDWGDLCAEDVQANEYAIQNGLRILSAYWVDSRVRGEQVRVYVITEADRSATTVLLTDEY